MLRLADRAADAWTPSVLAAVAQSGKGLAEVVDALDEHRAWLESTGTLGMRRTRRAKAEIEAIAVETLRARWTSVGSTSQLDEQAEKVVSGEKDPYAAADSLLAAE